jgi:hypothetical protein
MTIPSAYLTALVAALALLLAAVSALAGWLWCRLRTFPSQLRMAQLARDLADRQRALEALIDRLEPRPTSRRIRLDPPDSAPLPPTESAPRPQVRIPTHDMAPTASTDANSHLDLLPPTLIAVPDLATVVAADEAQLAAEARNAADLDQRHGALWALSDSGYAPDAIARQTGLPIGQVDLILALRKHASRA